MNRQMNKLLAIVSGIALMGLMSAAALWRGFANPADARFQAILYSVPIILFYLTVIVLVRRLKKGLADSEPGQPSAPSN
jgi:hypothetical protein